MNDITGVETICPNCGNRIYASLRQHYHDSVIRNGFQMIELCGNCHDRVFIEIRVISSIVSIRKTREE